MIAAALGGAGIDDQLTRASGQALFRFPSGRTLCTAKKEGEAEAYYVNQAVSRPSRSIVAVRGITVRYGMKEYNMG